MVIQKTCRVIWKKFLKGKARKTKVNVAVDDEEFVPPNRHQVVNKSVYSEPAYALLDSCAITDVM